MEVKSYAEEQLDHAISKEARNCGDCELYYRDDAAEICTRCYKESNWRPRSVSTISDVKDISSDMVNHPNHYKSETGLETIDVIEAFTFDLKGIEAVCTANVLKYICRWKKKNGLQDLEKAKWYLNKLIDRVNLINE